MKYKQIKMVSKRCFIKDHWRGPFSTLLPLTCSQPYWVPAGPGLHPLLAYLAAQSDSDRKGRTWNHSSVFFSPSLYTSFPGHPKRRGRTQNQSEPLHSLYSGNIYGLSFLGLITDNYGHLQTNILPCSFNWNSQKTPLDDKVALLFPYSIFPFHHIPLFCNDSLLTFSIWLEYTSNILPL